MVIACTLNYDFMYLLYVTCSRYLLPVSQFKINVTSKYYNIGLCNFG